MADREVAEHEMSIRVKLKSLGLPVLKAGIVEIKEGENAGVYLAQEPFLRKGGESVLIPINSQYSEHPEHPTFLSTLRPAKDRRLIEQLAKETALLFNAGFAPFRFDYYGFYRKKDGSWHHVIMDVEEIHKVGVNHSMMSARIRNMLNDVKHGIGQPPLTKARYWLDGRHPIYKLFERAFLRNLNPGFGVYESTRF
ncbi:MAG: hypothetical protein AABY11_02895 [archaeon]